MSRTPDVWVKDGLFFSTIALVKRKRYINASPLLSILRARIPCVRITCVSVCVCAWRHAPSASTPLYSVATDSACQGAATRVSDLSHRGVALFDDKRVLKTLGSVWGDRLLWRCSGAASNSSRSAAEAVRAATVSFLILILSFFFPAFTLSPRIPIFPFEWSDPLSSLKSH